MGAGSTVAGLFPTDPALGYPPGEPATVTAIGRVHILAGSLLFAGLIGTCFVLAKRFGRDGDRGWRVLGLVSGFVVTGTALAAGIVYRLETAGALADGPAGALERVAFLFGFGWLAASAVRLARSRTATGTGT